MNSPVFFRQKIWAMVTLILLFSPPGQANNYFDRYGLSPGSPAVDLGSQPLGYPSGVISTVMRHDRILKKALADAGQPLQVHAFGRGADMVALLASGQLEAGLLGDMPTILSAATGNIRVVGLVKHSATAIVAKGDTQVRGLAGKRIGYVSTSSAHHTLLQGLASAGLEETQAQLVPLRIDDMPDALERREIDAFAAWEPAPSIALTRSDKNRIVFRGLTTDYFVIEREFEKRSPQTARHVVAGFLRAIEWMRRSQRNIEKAARWVLADGEAFSGKPGATSIAQIVAITQREILSIPSAPAILSTTARPPLKNEFQFLAKLGKLPEGAQWGNVEAAFRYDGLARVMAEPRTYQIATFDYED